MPTHATGKLAGRYALESVVGRGGMADVHRATDEVLEREVAIKVLRTHATSDSDRARFHDEAQLLAALDHPGLVAVLDAGLAEDVPYLVMDLVDGESLSALLQPGPVPPHRVAALGADLATVLAYVHDHGIVHRDIKPSNVLVGRDGVVRLADFGIARMTGDGAGHTATGTTVGTAAYLAPEQVRGEAVTPASDVYSLGLVLLEALTGRRAYTGGPMEAAIARLHTAPLVPTSLGSGWTSLLTAMTDADPERRPTAARAARALHALTTPGAEPALARRTNDVVAEPAKEALAEPEPEPVVVRRPRWGWIGSGVAALVLGAGAVVLTTTGGSASTDDVPAGVSADLQQPLQDLHDAVDR